MNVEIKVIPHDAQAYETCGNWRFDQNGNLLIEVSDTGNWKHAALIALHEFIEVCLCKDRSIIQEAVDAFDLNYEKERKEGKHSPQDEPGDDPAAPYRKEHSIATGIERIMAAELNVDWGEYEKVIVALQKSSK